MNKLPKGILVLGFVSFFTDISSEMIYPLLPVFLSSVLGAGALALGLIEGIAESTASFFKVLSGYSTDRTERRKPFIIAGYGISGLARPLIAFAAGWPFVLVMRFLDRMGKGIRTSPRDALVADITQRGQRGVAFGLHRAMDHAGAVAGPLVAAALLGFAALSLRHVFFLAAIPSVLVMAIILFFVKEPAPKATKIDGPLNIYSQWKDLGRSFKYFLAAMLLFTLGNSTDAFLILRLSNAGISASHIAMLWSAHNVIRMISTYTGGRLADGFGSRKLIISGWIFYALIYAAFAFIRTPNVLDSNIPALRRLLRAERTSGKISCRRHGGSKSQRNRFRLLSLYRGYWGLTGQHCFRLPVANVERRGGLSHRRGAGGSGKHSSVPISEAGS